MDEPGIATEGPCKGHVCDNCARCRQGICCRRDRPGYQLPEFGDWDGPIYGEWGVLATDGTHVQCHCCGKWYVLLGSHTAQIHGLLADEYRAVFGLRARTSLAPVSYRERMRQLHGPVLTAYELESPLRSFTHEQRVAYAKGTRWRLEAKLDPKNKEIWRTAPWREKSAERTREHLSDPEYFAQFRRKVSEAKGGRVPIACAICGKTIAVKRSDARESAVRTCSKECFAELHRRAWLAKHPYIDPAAVLKTSQKLRERRGDYNETVERLRALGEAAFAVLSARDAAIVRQFYGLDGERGRTYREIRENFGVSGGTVHRVLRQGVARLLGFDAGRPARA